MVGSSTPVTRSPAQESDPKQHPLLRASTTFYDRVVTDWWWWELLSWTVSFGCVAAIVVVLWFYDGKKQAEYLLTGITLNAYVAVFAAVSKAALILPVSEAIGQLKWIWFRDEAALWDFQLYDAASRGPWGAAMLLIKTRCKHLVSLGALVTVLALAFEPFFQQILTYPDRVVPTEQSLTWAARSFLPASTSILRKQSDYADPSMSAVIDAAFNTPEIPLRPSTATCPTGNCTWPLYSTLGVCHQCQDVSRLLAYVCKNNTRLQNTGGTLAVDPCGYKVNDTFVAGLSGNLGFRTVTSLTTAVVDTFNPPSPYGPFWNTTSFNNATLPIANFYVGYTQGGPAVALRNETPVLVECLLSWCAKTLNVQFTNGTLKESVVDSVTIQPEIQDKNLASPIIAALGENTTFTIVNQTTQSLRNWVLSNLPPGLQQNPEFPFVDAGGMWQFHQQSPYDLDGYISNLTIAMTNNMKSRVFGTVPVAGTAWTTERYLKVGWVWITLPALSLLGSLVLICATIFKDRHLNAPVWKSSSLATLLHGLSEDTRRKIDANLSSSQTEAVAARLRVRLSSTEGNVRLVAV
ncbi:hypothetical protein BDW02DRAFT_601250 [Decorospora gaudefroyi]|uniref:Uncharacterized protein n=1 Tax=Decorospora gaudefroyi TaxID=184978 RepID=A0A6A5K7N6_9PLEO|nr:hypothetical protein BDW02DRAFT_601250 [Decorospora gaudefroyi]